MRTQRIVVIAVEVGPVDAVVHDVFGYRFVTRRLPDELEREGREETLLAVAAAGKDAPQGDAGHR